MSKVVAVADVHGCYDLLSKAMEDHLGSGAEVIFLGDLIDRSPQPLGDIKVVNFVRRLQQKPEEYGLSKVTVLRGNHEQLLLQAIKRNDSELWEYNGGSPAFLDYVKKNPKVHTWLRNLPYYAIRGDYLFVHAGVRPEVPIKEQSTHDLLWIREDFTESPHMLPYTIVHGHTIQNSDKPVYGSDRISCDLGAFATGNLCTLPLSY